MHRCKCKYCGEMFDRDKLPFIQVETRRYAHEECYNEHMANRTEEQAAEDEFYEYIKSIYGKNYNYVVINKQVQHYIKDYGYTWNGILKSLKWFYDVKHHKKDPSHNISIVPYIYEQAKNYYYSLWAAQEANKEKDLSDITNKTVEIVVQPQKIVNKKSRMFSMED